MSNIKLKIKSLVRKIGYDFYRFNPVRSPLARRMFLMQKNQVQVVLDVGANVGQYALEIRENGFRGEIISFEPQSKAFKKLKNNLANDLLWRGENIGLGSKESEETINISENSVSSSVLPMLDEHTKAAPSSAYIASEIIQVRALDEIHDNLKIDGKVSWLKIDVQGFESQVIDGALESLQKFDFIQFEAALVPLYGGEELLTTLIQRIESKGFFIVSFEPGFADPETGHLLQVDVILKRRED